MKFRDETKKPFRLNQAHRRLLVFLLILAGVFSYLGSKWDSFSKEVMVKQKQTAPEGAMLVRGEQSSSVTVTTGSAEKSEKGNGMPGDFYSAARLERDRIRSERIQTLKDLAADPKVTDAIRERAQGELLTVSERRQREAEAEMLLKAKGYDMSVVFLNEKGAVVVTGLARIEPSDAARISDLVATAAGISMSDVLIVPYKRQ